MTVSDKLFCNVAVYIFVFFPQCHDNSLLPKKVFEMCSYEYHGVRWTNQLKKKVLFSVARIKKIKTLGQVSMINYSRTNVMVTIWELLE